ncbi:PIR Superfamily Protein [Plasmodium ovale wallikeri]|uniref:PIR Superfamily Protein n=2 Tax=Plasmodium ovale TaxID=36330 RepID=A0A1A9AC39_PLAOA|nr:PIR Superfamily Protein [Plasmodium ovale wallikeri]SBT54073.1 PIR Superfamily Protein [Plasmodium ovale wallikeri]SBT76556.1 PIR protein [Plasmodium ovale]
MSDDYNYDFFKDIDKYTIYQSTVNQTDVSTIDVKDCNFDKNDFSEDKIEFAQSLCKKIKYLYQLITEDNLHILLTVKTDLGYINYWLNDELNKNSSHFHITAEEFYRKLKIKDAKYDQIDLKNKIRNIDEVHLNNMKMLEKMYVNYSELHKIIIVSAGEKNMCSRYSQVCYDEYEKAVKDCTNPNPTTLCNALEEYRKKYEHLYKMNEFLKRCPSDKLRKLPKNEEAIRQVEKVSQLELGILPTHPSDRNTSAIPITVIGVIFATFLFLFLLYMFTPFGSWLRPRIKKYIKFYRNLQREKHQSATHNSEIYSANSNNELYNIRYNSIQ